jgi:hypothetical protein
MCPETLYPLIASTHQSRANLGGRAMARRAHVFDQHSPDSILNRDPHVYFTYPKYLRYVVDHAAGTLWYCKWY